MVEQGDWIILKEMCSGNYSERRRLLANGGGNGGDARDSFCWRVEAGATAPQLLKPKNERKKERKAIELTVEGRLQKNMTNQGPFVFLSSHSTPVLNNMLFSPLFLSRLLLLLRLIQN